MQTKNNAQILIKDASGELFIMFYENNDTLTVRISPTLAETQKGNIAHIVNQAELLLMQVLSGSKKLS